MTLSPARKYGYRGVPFFSHSNLRTPDIKMYLSKHISYYFFPEERLGCKESHLEKKRLRKIAVLRSEYSDRLAQAHHSLLSPASTGSQTLSLEKKKSKRRNLATMAELCAKRVFWHLAQLESRHETKKSELKRKKLKTCDCAAHVQQPAARRMCDSSSSQRSWSMTGWRRDMCSAPLMGSLLTE